MHYIRSVISIFFHYTAFSRYCRELQPNQNSKCFKFPLSRLQNRSPTSKTSSSPMFQILEVNEQQCNYCAEDLFLLIMDDWFGINSL